MRWRLLQMTRDGERLGFSTHNTNWKLPEVCFALLAFQRLWFKTSEVTILSQHSKTWLYYMLKYWLSVQHANISLTQSPSNSAIRLTRKFVCAITDDREGESVTGLASEDWTSALSLIYTDACFCFLGSRRLALIMEQSDN